MRNPLNQIAVKDRPNLYLIGFMGVGKSAVGRGVAKKLGLEFLDSDREIEIKEGRAISAIFAEEGEAAFRQMERRFMEEGHPKTSHVVSCGGGLPMGPGMTELLKSSGIVVCMFASAETILSRVAGNDKRPLLSVENPEERIRSLLAEREPVYMKTGIGVSADRRGLFDVIENVARVYVREAMNRRKGMIRKVKREDGNG